jgi:hypothetical protein
MEGKPMSDHGDHCPFLNRSDARCSKNFSLDRLNNTYDYCFGEYAACSTYLELLVERRVRRLRESVLWTKGSRQRDLMHDSIVQITHSGRRIEAA